MKVKYLWIPFAVFLAALLPLRLYQVLYLIDPETGFSTGNPYVLQILLGALALFVLILMFMCLMCKNTPERYGIRRNLFAGVFSGLVGISLLTESAFFLRDFIFSQDRTPPSLIQSILGVLAAAVFLMMAFCSFAGRNLLERVPMLTLLPTVWCCVRLVFSFLSYTNIATNSSDMLDLLSTSFLLIFLFTQAKLLSGFTTPKSGKRAVVAGLSAVVLLLVFRAPSLFQMISTGNFVFSAAISYITDLLLALYVFAVAVELSIQFSRQVEEAEEPAGEEEAEMEGEEDTSPRFFDSLVQHPAGVPVIQRQPLPAKKDPAGFVSPAPLEPAAPAPIPFPRKTVPPAESAPVHSAAKESEKEINMDHIDRLIEDICKESELSDILHEEGRK